MKKTESAEFLQILMLNKEQTFENRCQKVDPCLRNHAVSPI